MLGTVLRVIGVGKMTDGFCFGKTVRKLKEYSLPFSFVSPGLSIYMIGISDRIIFSCWGIYMCVFFRAIIPYLINEVNN